MKGRGSILSVLLALVIIVFGGDLLFDLTSLVFPFSWKYVWYMELPILGSQLWVIWMMVAGHSILTSLQMRLGVVGVIASILFVLGYSDVLMVTPGYCGNALLSGELDQFFAESSQNRSLVEYIKTGIIGLFILGLTFRQKRA